MITLFVTRHQGARDWAAGQNLSDAVIVEHLLDTQIAQLTVGDIVIGTLPVQIVAQVNAQGARYLHLEMVVPLEARGRDLSAGEMNTFGARLAEYQVVQIPCSV